MELGKIHRRLIRHCNPSHTHTHTLTHILFLLFDNLYSKEVVRPRVYDYEHVGKLRLEDGSSVVPPVLAPHNVDFVISQMPHLHNHHASSERERDVSPDITSLILIKTTGQRC